MTISEFKKLFMIEKKYEKYKDLYKRVIKPTYEELHENADCWFEVAEKYATPGDDEPYKLAFKVIKSAISKAEQDRLDKIKMNIANMCYVHLRMEDSHMQQLLPKMTLANAQKVVDKIVFLGIYIENKEIKNEAEYALKGLLQELLASHAYLFENYYRHAAAYEGSDDYFRLYSCITGYINDKINE